MLKKVTKSFLVILLLMLLIMPTALAASHHNYEVGDPVILKDYSIFQSPL